MEYNKILLASHWGLVLPKSQKSELHQLLLSFDFRYEDINNHVIAANEGSAIGIAIGYNLATQKIPLVYLQNSGLGNAVNPLLSLADKKVYSIPMLLMIGWRGAPGTKDEPQHEVKGAVTKKILSLLDIKTIELKEEKDLKKLDTHIKNKSLG